MLNCGLLPLAAIAVFCLVIFAAGMRAQAGPLPEHIVPDKERAKIVTLFTMEGCGPCEKLQAYMKKHGVRIMEPIVTKEQPLVPEGTYPAVCYLLNGKYVWDNGERIYAHKYWLPERAIERVHYTPN